LTESVLIYRPRDFSFDVEPRLPGFTSVVVNDLSLEVDENGKVMKVWGYCPHVEWIRSRVLPGSADRLEVFAIGDQPFLRGVSQGVNSECWPVFVDQQSGWVCLDSGRVASSYAEILEGAILALDDRQQLAVVYLKPKRLPQIQ
jgi:hypothetical protein